MTFEVWYPKFVVSCDGSRLSSSVITPPSMTAGYNQPRRRATAVESSQSCGRPNHSPSHSVIVGGSTCLRPPKPFLPGRHVGECRRDLLNERGRFLLFVCASRRERTRCFIRRPCHQWPLRSSWRESPITSGARTYAWYSPSCKCVRDDRRYPVASMMYSRLRERRSVACGTCVSYVYTLRRHTS